MKIPRRSTVIENANLPDNVPIIGLGCSSFSHFFWCKEELEKAGGVSRWTPETMDRSNEHVQEWIRTIRSAVLEHGITLLDTAPWYGHGTSEVVMGWAFEELFCVQPALRAKLIINTKVGRYDEDPQKQFDFSYDNTIRSVERSLKRLNCHYIDVLQLHDPEYAPTLSVLIDEAIPALLECREKGWCKAIGLTGYPLEVQHQILEVTLQKYGTTRIFDQALTYCHYNLHDMSLVKRPITIDGKSSYADFVASQKMVLMAAAPLSMGLLTHDGPPEWHPAAAALKNACKEAAAICQTEGINISELAITVALANPIIPCTLLGMKNVEQVKLAAATAGRFASVAATETDPEIILKQVLNDAEHKVYLRLKDETCGPFSEVWKGETFRWDGAKDGYEFWNQVDDVAAEPWQNPPC